MRSGLINEPHFSHPLEFLFFEIGLLWDRLKECFDLLL